MAKEQYENKPLVARISYGKRARIPDKVLEDLDVDVGDILLFKKKDGHYYITAAEIVERK